YTFLSLNAGDTIDLIGIPAQYEKEGLITDTTIQVIGIGTDLSYPLVSNIPEATKLIIGDTLSMQLFLVTPMVYATPSDDTFISNGGSYTYENILNSFNVFSFNDVEGTHIVGPIVAKENAYYTFDRDDNSEASTVASILTINQEAADYIPGSTYNSGDLVKYDGKTYKANWWTTSIPGSDDSWEMIVEPNEDGSIDYPNGMPYSAGDIVNYQGNQYEAKYWTNTVPGSDGSWELLNSVGSVSGNSGFGGTGVLIASDYSNGISSYVGNLLENKINVSSFNINYDFENQIDENGNLVLDENPKPNLYTKLTGNTVTVEKEADNITDNYYFYSNGNKIVGPNNYGKSPIMTNDNYIDFDLAKKDIIESASKLIEGPTIEFPEETEKLKQGYNHIVKPDENGYLKLQVGYDYIIKDSDKLNIIDLIYPEGYDPKTRPYPVPTHINIVGDSLPISGQNFNGFDLQPYGWLGERRLGQINGEYFQFMPIIFVDSMPFNAGGGQGEGSEFGYINNIVFNLPNIKTDNGGHKVNLRDLISGFLGHIIAPNAEFYMYDRANGQIVGGDMNGSAIVDSWHSGEVEVHMWPYQPQDNKIEFTKTDATGDNPLANAEFKIEQVVSKEDLTYKPSGYYLEITTEEDGILSFPGIIPGEVYKLTETKAPDGYEIPTGYWIIEVSNNMQITITTVQSGEVSTPDIVNNKIANVMPGEEPDIEPEEEEEEKNIGFKIVKNDEATGELLEGAEFELYLADEDGKPTGNVLITNLVSGKDGMITVEENELLQLDTLYVLVETKAPDGYIIGQHKLFYIKGTEGLYEDLVNVVISNNEIITVGNVKESYILPETGGVGVHYNILIGMTSMISAGVLIKKKYK
ncbi:MAG: SpaA isopeptide-forming pilin-related protein, partial [Peptostreptococcaceae bacterium]